MPKCFCSLSSLLTLDGPIAPFLSCDVRAPFAWPMRGLAGTISLLGRPFIVGSAVMLPELWLPALTSCALFRVKNENRCLSFLDGLGDKRSSGLGAFAAAALKVAPARASLESHVADVIGLSTPGMLDKDFTSGAKEISKPAHG